MVAVSRTFGDFYDAVSQTSITEGLAWVATWQHLLGEDWPYASAMQLTEDAVVCFTQAMIGMLQERLQCVGTRAFYDNTYRRGYAFLQEVCAVAESFGFTVTVEIPVPSPAAAVVAD